MHMPPIPNSELEQLSGLQAVYIIRGANVENAAFPSGICAERSALSNSISNYPEDKPVAIAIAAMTEMVLLMNLHLPAEIADR